MSCNGCRVLRKGCSESCILRPCLQWLESAEAQGHATVFVAKFFGRAGLMSFISAVPESQRPALFQSLLFEACGRTVNPVNGAVGLLWTGNWHVCQAAVETVLRGGTLRPILELLGSGSPSVASNEASEIRADMWRFRQDSSEKQDPSFRCRFSTSRSKTSATATEAKLKRPMERSTSVVDLNLNYGFPAPAPLKAVTSNRPATPSMNSDESVMTSCWENAFGDQYGHGGERELLNLFV